MAIICMYLLILRSKLNLTCKIVEVKPDLAFSARMFHGVLFIR
jgi:hypothetical protein